MSRLSSEVTFGADPEFFIFDPATSRRVPAWEFTKGTKENHEAVPGMKGIDMHADGVAVEFNLPPSPAKNFHRELYRAFSHFRGLVSIKGWQISNSCIETDFDAKSLMHPLALRSGCDPDFCAYNEDVTEERPPLKFTPTLPRFAGGHIHIGYPTEYLPRHALIKMIEGLWRSQYIYRDSQGDRQKFYGRAGTFRPKSYGVEYRSPSNYWLFGDYDDISSFTSYVISIFDKLQDRPGPLNDWYQAARWNVLQEALNGTDNAACEKIANEILMSYKQV